MSSAPLHLPSLVLCRHCDVGATFENYEDAQKAAGNYTELANRDDWPPITDAPTLDAPNCSICMEPLNRPAEDDRTAGKEVEALFENPECGHCFHRACLVKFMKGRWGQSLRCPLCRKPIAQSVIDSIFERSEGVREVPENEDEAAVATEDDEDDEDRPTFLSMMGDRTSEAYEYEMHMPETIRLLFSKLRDMYTEIEDPIRSCLLYTSPSPRDS